jgi:hypothetical protein
VLVVLIVSLSFVVSNSFSDGTTAGTTTTSSAAADIGGGHENIVFVVVGPFVSAIIGGMYIVSIKHTQ